MGNLLRNIKILSRKQMWDMWNKQQIGFWAGQSCIGQIFTSTQLNKKRQLETEKLS